MTGALLCLFIFAWYATLLIIYCSLIKIKDFNSVKNIYKLRRSHSGAIWLYTFIISAYFLRVGVRFNKYEIKVSELLISINIFFILVLILSLVLDISTIIKIYIRKLFDISYENDDLFDWYFEGLSNTPYAILYYLFRKLKTSTFVVFFLIISTQKQSVFALLIIPIALLVIESVWLMYLAQIMPFKSLSINRIEIFNQMLVIVCWISCWISCIWLYLFYTKSQDDIANVILTTNEILYAVCLFPSVYILIGLHNLIIPLLYIKKRNIMYPRFWKMKNPNERYASNGEMTEYMPILINAEI